MTRHAVRSMVFLFAALASTSADAETYVCATDSIRVFADNAAGNDAPLRVITGPTTGINECYDVAYDHVHREIIVAKGDVSVFAADANGDATPLRNISGTTAVIGGLVFANAVAVDVQADEIVVGATGPTVLAFARTANGDIAPKRSFAPQSIDVAVAVFVDRLRGQVVVSGNGSGTVGVYDRISGSVSHAAITASAPRGLFVDPAGVLFVANAAGVSGYDNTGALIGTLAAPLITAPWGIAITRDSQIWIANENATASAADPLLLYAVAYGPNALLAAQIYNGAPGSTFIHGIASSLAATCGPGHVACDSVFQDGFD